MMRHTKHYYRALFLLVGGALLFLLVRAFLLPESFGQYGFYRGANIEEQMEKLPHFAKLNACADCHDTTWKSHQEGVHKKIQCQNCHDALSAHVDVKTGEMVGKMPIEPSKKLCLRCHWKLPSRPVTIPQIDLEDHLDSLPNAQDANVCSGCHNPHDPNLEGLGS